MDNFWIDDDDDDDDDQVNMNVITLLFTKNTLLFSWYTMLLQKRSKMK